MLIAYLGLSLWDGPARTLEFQVDRWTNNSWGLHDIGRQQTRCEVAIAGDGSRSNRCEHESFRHYFIREGHWTEHSLYSRREHAAFYIDHPARKVLGGPCRCSWTLPTAIADDRECSRTAAERLFEGKRIGTGQIAGHAVVRYRSVDERGEETELSWAPGLACEVMEEIRTWPGTFGIPGAKWQYRVTSYKPGEPDWNLFQLPAGYAVQSDGAPGGG